MLSEIFKISQLDSQVKMLNSRARPNDCLKDWFCGSTNHLSKFLIWLRSELVSFRHVFRSGVKSQMAFLDSQTHTHIAYNIIPRSPSTVVGPDVLSAKQIACREHIVVSESLIGGLCEISACKIVWGNIPALFSRKQVNPLESYSPGY